MICGDNSPSENLDRRRIRFWRWCAVYGRMCLSADRRSTPSATAWRTHHLQGTMEGSVWKIRCSTGMYVKPGVDMFRKDLIV